MYSSPSVEQLLNETGSPTFTLVEEASKHVMEIFLQLLKVKAIIAAISKDMYPFMVWWFMGLVVLEVKIRV